MSIESLKKNTEAMEICAIIERHGYSAYCVGGCVRDALMDVDPCDIDITTSAVPEQICKIFLENHCQVIPTGASHGTVTVIYKGKNYEITTMRCDGEYQDFRHPDAVTFVDDICVDLSRRDFTINAMAYSFFEDKIYDYYGGMQDILTGTIRCVGAPSVRFGEDALRILRALRFSSVLGFEIDQETKIAIREFSHNIRELSRERKKHEFDRLILGDFAGDIIYEYSDVLSYVIEELEQCKGFLQHSNYHSYDVLKHICKTINATPPLLHLRYAALFHDIAKPKTFSLDDTGQGHFYGHAKKSTEIAERVAQDLRFDNKTKDAVLTLVSHHDTPLPTDVRLIKRRISKLGKDMFFDLIALCRADYMAQSSLVSYRLETYDEIELLAKAIINSDECIDRNKLMINGNDIIKLGVNSGRDVGRILSYLLDEVIDGRLENKSEALLAAAVEFIRVKLA